MVQAPMISDNRSGPVKQTRVNGADVIALTSHRVPGGPAEAGVPEGGAGKAEISKIMRICS